MAHQSSTIIRAHLDNIEQLVAVLNPLRGGIWLTTDVRTLVHWVVIADRVVPFEAQDEERSCRAFGIVTILTPDNEPGFLINERDIIDWIEPDRVLAVREPGDDCEIRLERLDDLDARLIDSFNLSRPENATLRTLSVGKSRYLQIYDDQLPTGSAEADAALLMIEQTIEARRRLVGPTAGSLEVIEQMAVDLVSTLRAYPVESYVWAATLQERIERMRDLLAA